jgi:hypothetical protein
MSEQRSMKESLARYMDPRAFDLAHWSGKHTSKAQGGVVVYKHKLRRQIALKRANAAIRFFLRPDNYTLLTSLKETDRAG